MQTVVIHGYSIYWLSNILLHTAVVSQALHLIHLLKLWHAWNIQTRLLLHGMYLTAHHHQVVPTCLNYDHLRLTMIANRPTLTRERLDPHLLVAVWSIDLINLMLSTILKLGLSLLWPTSATGHDCSNADATENNQYLKLSSSVVISEDIQCFGPYIGMYIWKALYRTLV